MNQTEREKGKGRPSPQRSGSRSKLDPTARRKARSAGAGGADPREDLFARRKRIISALPQDDARRAPALAMCEFDRRTDPEELKRTRHFREQIAVEQLVVHLRFRCLQRASWALRALPFEPDRAQDQRAARHALVVEPLVRRALLALFPGPRTTPPPRRQATPLAQRLDLRRFEATFAAFTVGDLAMPRIDPSIGPADPLCNHGIADGVNMFAFAESALYFVRLGHRPEFWRPLLPMFTAAAEHFAAHYWDRVQRACGGYLPANLKAPVMTKEAFLAVVNQRHRALPLSALLQSHGATLAAALQQDPHIAIPDCTQKEFA